MYFDALEFLEEEREAWRPFEALGALDDAALTRPVAGAHGWTGRDLMGHLLAWQEFALHAATELAMGASAPSIAAMDADWDARGGDVVNAEIQATWAAVPLETLRHRFGSLPGELRGYLTVVPEVRWVKHPAHMQTFLQQTIEHYADHRADLEAILAAAG